MNDIWPIIYIVFFGLLGGLVNCFLTGFQFPYTEEREDGGKTIHLGCISKCFIGAGAAFINAAVNGHLQAVNLISYQHYGIGMIFGFIGSYVLSKKIDQTNPHEHRSESLPDKSAREFTTVESLENLCLDELYDRRDAKNEELRAMLKRIKYAGAFESLRLSKLLSPIVDDFCELRRVIHEKEEEEHEQLTSAGCN